jgi:CRP-like cAMP-binding protein
MKNENHRDAEQSDSPIDEIEVPSLQWPDLIKRIPAFGLIPQDTVDALERDFELRALTSHEILFFEKEISYDVYLVMRGLATVTYVDSTGRRILLEVLGPGDWVGDLPFMPEPLRGRLRCDALHECAVGRIDLRRVIEILFGMPFERFANGAAFLFGAWPGRFAHAALVRGWPLRERLLNILNYLAIRFGVQNDLGSIVNLPLTHSDLADLVSASRPKVSHHMRLLEKEGLVVHERHRITLAPPMRPAAREAQDS